MTPIRQLQTERFVLTFAGDGRPSSFRLTERNCELLQLGNPGRGFYLTNGSTETLFTHIYVEQPNRLIARTANETQEIIFTVEQEERYLAFRIERLKGIPTTGSYNLHFEINTQRKVSALALGYMTELRISDTSLHVDWLYLWHGHPEDPQGGFSLYYGDSEDEEDEITLEIWVQQQLPHPKLNDRWTVENAKKWISNWQAKFKDRSQMIVEGMSIQELYDVVPFAENANIQEIYLFTNTWRNDGFWPSHEINWHVNRKVFPNGEQDLRAYSDYLQSRGIRLNLHYVSGGIGFYDPVYVGSKPDRRLAAWGMGNLSEDASAQASTLHFQPNKGSELPYLRVSGNAHERPPSLPHFFTFNFVRIGDEIIQVGSFENTDREIWTLTDCQRGMFLTDATDHDKGEETVGLIATYGINFIPDNNSTLLEEIAHQYAGFINRCGIAHTEYDGGEIHCYNGNWGYRKFTSMVYAALDHPVTAHDSSASAPACHLEYKLNSTRRLMQGTNVFTHGNHSVPLILASQSRPASTMLDTHFALSQGNLGGALGIARPEPMFGISLNDLQGHGLLNRMTKALHDWKEIAARLTESERKRINDSFHKPTPKFQRTPHPMTQVIYQPSEQDGQYYLTPVHILQRGELDIPWEQGQEHGPIAPRQFIQPDDSIKLYNPNPKQELKTIIRLLPSFDYTMADVDVASFVFDKHRGPMELVEANNRTESTQAQNITSNLNLHPAYDAIRMEGDTHIEDGGDRLIVTQNNSREEERWEANKLPWWKCRVDMRNHRGIGMMVHGDGSGAILLLHIPGRDYIVPIDFIGSRYIEIPHGEVSWYDNRWGWRMDTKSTRYAHVDIIKFGFGYVPPGTHARVEVSGIKALYEIPAILSNPVLETEQGKVSIIGQMVPEQILEYNGGDTAVLFDSNWNKITEYPVVKQGYEVREGWNTVRISAAESIRRPWMEVQFITEGDKISVGVRSNEERII